MDKIDTRVSSAINANTTTEEPVAKCPPRKTRQTRQNSNCKWTSLLFHSQAAGQQIRGSSRRKICTCTYNPTNAAAGTIDQSTIICPLHIPIPIIQIRKPKPATNLITTPQSDQSDDPAAGNSYGCTLQLSTFVHNRHWTATAFCKLCNLLHIRQRID